MKVLTTLLCLTSAALIAGARGEECASEGFLYYRMFVMLSNYTQEAIPSNYKLHQEAYGTCRDVDERKDEVLRYFESYGFNMSHVRTSPFRKHTHDAFTFSPYSNPPESNLRANLGSFYEYAEVINSRVTFGSWGLLASKDVEGPKGKISAGTIFLIGVYRFAVDGRDRCIDYQYANPQSRLVTSDRYTPLVLDLYNVEWGQGSMRGLTTKYDNGQVDYRAVMSFPPSQF